MRSSTLFTALIAGLLTTTIGLAATPAIPTYIASAIADSSRPAADIQRDAARKPAEVLTFAGVKPGDKVGELIPGRGYFSQLFCRIVGSQGHVYTMNINRTVQVSRPPPDVASDAMGAAPTAAAKSPCDNITAGASNAAELSLQSGLDLVWTSENYHDLNNKMFGSPDMKKFNKAVYDALKPGGVYLVEDHAAEAGSGGRDTETLHRIDVEQVKKDVLSAGFVFDSASDVLHNADDPHTARVFDMNGKSDKFLLKFRKPAR